MAKAPSNRYVESLLEIADELALHGGVNRMKQVALRRAVSSAYYAVFHALCTICADCIVGRSKEDLVTEVYRSLDHGVARRKLSAASAVKIASEIGQIGSHFAMLQEKRHSADYAPPIVIFNRTETFALISQAREAVRLIQELDAEARTRLAILLVINKRAA